MTYRILGFDVVDSALWKGVGVRWLIFCGVFALSVSLPAAIPNLNSVPGPLPRWWLLWIMMSLAVEGFTDGGGGETVYFRETAIFMAIAFWVVVGFFYACAMRRFKLRYAVLGAYPAMILVIVVLTRGLAALGYYHYSSL